MCLWGKFVFEYFVLFGGVISLIPPNLNSNSITISTRFRSGTKLFCKLRFRVECVVNSRLSAFQRTKNHQKPFTEFGDRVHQRCRSRSVTEHARLHAYVRSERTYAWSLACSVTDLDRHLWWTLSPNSVNGFWWFLVRWKAESLEFTTHSTRNGSFQNNFVTERKRVEIVIEFEFKFGGMRLITSPKSTKYSKTIFPHKHTPQNTYEACLYQIWSQTEQYKSSMAHTNNILEKTWGWICLR